MTDGRLFGPDGQPTRAVVIVAKDDLPECWARGWCSEACKAQALAVLAHGQLMAPIAGPVPVRWPFLSGN